MLYLRIRVLGGQQLVGLPSLTPDALFPRSSWWATMNTQCWTRQTSDVIQLAFFYVLIFLCSVWCKGPHHTRLQIYNSGLLSILHNLQWMLLPSRWQQKITCIQIRSSPLSHQANLFCNKWEKHMHSSRLGKKSFIYKVLWSILSFPCQYLKRETIFHCYCSWFMLQLSPLRKCLSAVDKPFPASEVNSYLFDLQYIQFMRKLLLFKPSL